MPYRKIEFTKQVGEYLLSVFNADGEWVYEITSKNTDTVSIYDTSALSSYEEAANEGRKALRALLLKMRMSALIVKGDKIFSSGKLRKNGVTAKFVLYAIIGIKHRFVTSNESEDFGPFGYYRLVTKHKIDGKWHTIDVVITTTSVENVVNAYISAVQNFLNNGNTYVTQYAAGND